MHYNHASNPFLECVSLTLENDDSSHHSEQWWNDSFIDEILQFYRGFARFLNCKHNTSHSHHKSHTDDRWFSNFTWKLSLSPLALWWIDSFAVETPQKINRGFARFLSCKHNTSWKFSFGPLIEWYQTAQFCVSNQLRRIRLLRLHYVDYSLA